jgi:rhamnosyltransferase
MRKDFAIGVVTYHPDSILLVRIELALEAGFVVYVYDNSPEDEMVRQYCRQHPGCRYLTCGKNIGLGFAISSLCAHAYYDSFTALLFFDQDSVFDAATLRHVGRFLSTYPDVQADHAVVTFTSAPLSKPDSSADFALTPVRLTINSGSLYFLANAKAMNWHNEHYFVDGVDYEFCLRASAAGLRVSECRATPGFDHVREQGTIRLTVLGRTRWVRRYSMRRIVDSSKSSCRLVLASLLLGQVSFALRFARILISYLALQLLLRSPTLPPVILKAKE